MVSTSSDISIGTYSNIKAATESEITVSTNSIIKKASVSIATRSVLKGDFDIYGNVIEYDPEAWIGEDHIQDDNIGEKVVKNFQNTNIGTVELYLDDNIYLDKTNILISVIDEGYNMHDIYLYYRNDYHEKIELLCGKYKVNKIIPLSEEKINLELSENQFVVIENDVTSLCIREKNSIKENIVATMPVATESELSVSPQKHKSNFLIIFLFILIMVVIGYIVYKKIKERKEEF